MRALTRASACLNVVSRCVNALRQWASRLKRDLEVIALAIRDPRVPRRAKILAGLTIAYAASPIDLIPDFIPVLGLLDDLLIVPVGLWMTLRLIPPEVLKDLRKQASAPGYSRSRRRSLVAACIVILIWVGCVIWALYWVRRWMRH